MTNDPITVDIGNCFLLSLSNRVYLLSRSPNLLEFLICRRQIQCQLIIVYQILPYLAQNL
ncbi:hypothetical protein RchiOBHm_Chr4g0443141 [Rosa chinensis]|uniref:Uncharacterized protein n=1 Tax=Rosa chinensis TaxID=74649 RepID=A0A2P6R3T3_ROSCH|nr:hypothetical protein RchiOBHm_Chr4g0443141 [Rosa chinensis]